MRKRGVNVRFPGSRTSLPLAGALGGTRSSSGGVPTCMADTWTEVFVDIERPLRAYSIHDTLRLIDRSKQGDPK